MNSEDYFLPSSALQYGISQNTVLHSRNIVVVIYTSFLYFLMEKYIDFYHRHLEPTKMVSAKTVSVLVNISYSSVH